jgi:Family of unknown function (DUF5413)
MKRLFIFALLGPPLGLFTGLWVILPIFNWALVDKSVFDYHQVVLVPVSYLVGIVPACLTALVDGFFAGRRVRYGPLWTTLFGFAFSFLPLASSFAAGFIHGPFILVFGFVGALPAFVCSWLARKIARPALTG